MSFDGLLAQQAADVHDAAVPAARLFLFNREMTQHIPVNRIISWEFEQILNETGQMRVVIPADPDYLAVTADVHPDAAIPMVAMIGEHATCWFVTHVTEIYEAGDDVLELSLVSAEAHLEHMYTWMDALLPAEAQVTKVKIAMGPVAVIVKHEILKPNFERFSNSPHRVKALSLADGHTRHTMVTMQMDQAFEVIKTLLDVEGLTVEARPHVPGLTEVPGFGDQPCLVWDVVQRAQLPHHGLIIMGVIRSVGALWDDVWRTLTGFYRADDALAQNSHRYWGQPQYVIRKEMVQRYEITTQKPTAYRATVGGKSPEWLNNILSMGIRALIEKAVPGLGIVLDVTGLDEILDNRIGAYHSWKDSPRYERMGRFGFFEEFRAGTGLTLEAFFALREIQWKTRSTKTYTAEIEPGDAFAVGRELVCGQMVALELPRDRAIVAFVTRIKFRWDAGTDPYLEVHIGERPKRDPQDAVVRRLRSLSLVANKLMLLD